MNRALLRHRLPFGAKAAEPMPLDSYPFSHDAKTCKVREEVEPHAVCVGLLSCRACVGCSFAGLFVGYLLGIVLW